MRPAVLAGFNDFTDKFEGYVPWMYLDVKQLVTIGRGDLIDPLVASGAIDLPFVHLDGTPATKGEITDEFNHIKGLGEAGARGGAAIAHKVATLHLTKDGINALSNSRLQLDDQAAAKRWPDWEQKPARAQLATLSMMWAMGSGFPTFFPHWDAAFRANDWDACAAQCHISEIGNPGVALRNVANVKLFQAAGDGDPSGL